MCIFVTPNLQACLKHTKNIIFRNYYTHWTSYAKSHMYFVSLCKLEKERILTPRLTVNCFNYSAT